MNVSMFRCDLIKSETQLTNFGHLVAITYRQQGVEEYWAKS